MSKFSSIRDFLTPDAALGVMLDKAQFQHNALGLVRETIAALTGVPEEQIASVYVDARVIRVFCAAPVWAARLQPLHTTLLAALQQRNGRFFPESIGVLEVAVALD